MSDNTSFEVEDRVVLHNFDGVLTPGEVVEVKGNEVRIKWDDGFVDNPGLEWYPFSDFSLESEVEA